MATETRPGGHDGGGDAFSGRDEDDEVTIADLRAFGDQLGASIVGTIRRDLDERERDEARRDLVTGAAGATPAPGAQQPDPLAELSARLGISPDTLARAAASAKAAEQAEELRPYIAECIREELPAALDEILVDDGNGEPGNGKRTARKGASRPASTTPNAAEGAPRPMPDTAPESTHWSERPLWGGRR